LTDHDLAQIHGSCTGALASTLADRAVVKASQIDLAEVNADVAAQGAALAPVRTDVGGIKAASGSSLSISSRPWNSIKSDWLNGDLIGYQEARGQASQSLPELPRWKTKGRPNVPPACGFALGSYFVAAK
jgi:hypothetical protein